MLSSSGSGSTNLIRYMDFNIEFGNTGRSSTGYNAIHLELTTGLSQYHALNTYILLDMDEKIDGILRVNFTRSVSYDIGSNINSDAITF
jgi:hypothetical protein